MLQPLSQWDLTKAHPARPIGIPLLEEWGCTATPLLLLGKMATDGIKELQPAWENGSQQTLFIAKLPSHALKIGTNGPFGAV